MHTNNLFSLNNKHNDETNSYANAVKDELFNPLQGERNFNVATDVKGGEGQCKNK